MADAQKRLSLGDYSSKLKLAGGAGWFAFTSSGDVKPAKIDLGLGLDGFIPGMANQMKSSPHPAFHGAQLPPHQVYDWERLLKPVAKLFEAVGKSTWGSPSEKGVEWVGKLTPPTLLEPPGMRASPVGPPNAQLKGPNSVMMGSRVDTADVINAFGKNYLGSLPVSLLLMLDADFLKTGVNPVRGGGVKYQFLPGIGLEVLMGESPEHHLGGAIQLFIRPAKKTPRK